jgi:hypothetical protein
VGSVTDAAAFVRVRIWGTVNFPDADPDMTPVIGPSDVRIRIFATDRAPWVLTIQADTDLLSGTDMIPASNISWVPVPRPPFQAGTLSTVMPQLLGSGPNRVIVWGRLYFYMQNSWGYSPGNYTGTATITMSQP